MSEALDGPTKSKSAIDQLEEYIRDNCQAPVKLKEFISRYQYLTGHEPRKIMQYLYAIISGSNHVRIFSNAMEKYIVWDRSYQETTTHPQKRVQGLEEVKQRIESLATKQLYVLECSTPGCNGYWTGEKDSACPLCGNEGEVKTDAKGIPGANDGNKESSESSA